MNDNYIKAQLHYDRQEPKWDEEEQHQVDDIVDALTYDVGSDQKKLEKLAYALLNENITADDILKWIK
jgi:hypothetical protein